MGPTAAGKTAVACELIQQFPFEIVSIDSAMIYRGMNIGTAKPDSKTLTNAPHYLIDILDPIESYSAAQCCVDVSEICEKIIKKGKIPLLVGGTMMYFRALQQGLSVLPAADELTRKSILEQADAYGWQHLHGQLSKIDPLSAARIHPSDTQRIQRALEVYQLSNKPLSSFIAEQKRQQDTCFVNLILMPEDRSWLHQRIGQRFKSMLNEGFVDEVIELNEKWVLTPALPSMRCVGYRQVLMYLDGHFAYDCLIEKGIAATRQLAKRQLTWLRHWPEGHYFAAENPTNLQELMAFIIQTLDNSK